MSVAAPPVTAAPAAPTATPTATPVADDYEVFCRGVRDLCGVDLAQYRRPQMERRLRAFFERRGIETLAESLPVLRADRAHLDELLDRMTINVSQLWRHPAQIDHLAAVVLPELAAAGRVRAWSAGCSYGAEAYTIAAECRRVIPDAAVTIVGTDIDRRMIRRARTGRFSAQDARGVAPATMALGFERQADGWQARDELRALVRFDVGDLLRVRPLPGAYDLVVCRNTVIYFSEPVRDALHARLARTVRRGGYLLVGATERIADAGSLGLHQTAPFFYRKEA